MKNAPLGLAGGRWWSLATEALPVDRDRMTALIHYEHQRWKKINFFAKKKTTSTCLNAVHAQLHWLAYTRNSRPCDVVCLKSKHFRSIAGMIAPHVAIHTCTCIYAIEVKHETLPANRVRLLDRTSAGLLHCTGRPELRTSAGLLHCTGRPELRTSAGLLHCTGRPELRTSAGLLHCTGRPELRTSAGLLHCTGRPELRTSAGLLHCTGRPELRTSAGLLHCTGRPELRTSAGLLHCTGRPELRTTHRYTR